jgi:MFS family permease
MGIISTAIFVILRGLQGFALGGEYTTAGTLLMDQFSKKKIFH